MDNPVDGGGRAGLGQRVSGTVLDVPTRPQLRHVSRPFLGTAALAEGVLTERQLRGPQVHRLFRGVYVPAGMPVDHELRARALTLVSPTGSAISGRSAAVVHGVPLARPLDPVEVSVSEELRFGPLRGTVVRRTELSGGDSQPWSDGRVTTPLRTVFDLARSRATPDAVADVDAFLRATGMPLEQVQKYLLGRRNHGVARARDVLALTDPRAESPRESLVRCHLNLAGLWPEPQLEVRLADGSRVWVDLGFERERVAVEYDGGWHALREQLAADRARQNAMQQIGWTTVFVTSRSFDRGPAAWVSEVRGALAASRWT